jgi:hypothetical protein
VRVEVQGAERGRHVELVVDGQHRERVEREGAPNATRDSTSLAADAARRSSANGKPPPRGTRSAFVSTKGSATSSGSATAGRSVACETARTSSSMWTKCCRTDAGERRSDRPRVDSRAIDDSALSTPGP